MVIVDTYNLLLAEGVGGIDLAELEAMARSSRFARRGVVLVCDGVGRSGAASLTQAAGASGSGVRVIAAGPGRDADSLIERMLESDSAPSRLLVVSNDRRLQKAARRVRASWLGCKSFFRRLQADQERSRPAPLPSFATDLPLDRGSVGHWLSEFGIAGASTPEEVAGLPREPDASPKPASSPMPKARKRDVAPPAQPKKAQGRVLPQGETIDPLLLDALEAWAIRPEDLDMGRWLK